MKFTTEEFNNKKNESNLEALAELNQNGSASAVMDIADNIDR